MIAVTGATGHLGRLVIEALLQKVPSSQIVAAVRDPAKAKDLAAKGVQVRVADYDKPETLTSAFQGVQKLLLISANVIGQRARQHAAAISAAKQAGVSHVVYTSMLRADRSGMFLAGEHKATEETLRASGIPFTFLRNGWYFENYTENLGPALQHGAFLGSAKDGKIAAAARRDFADAAVTAVTEPGHEGKIYELAGDTAFTMTQLAEEVSKQVGKPLVYKDLPMEQYKGILLSAGLPEPVAHMLADSDVGITRGELDAPSTDMRKLIRRPTTTLADAVKVALKK